MALDPLTIGLGVVAVGASGAVFVLARWLVALQSTLALVARAARRAAAGETHVVLPVRGTDAVAVISGALNDLIATVRAARLDQMSDRVFDQAMVRETPNGLVVVDEAGRVRRFNPAFTKLLPVRGDAVGNKPIDVVAVPELEEVLEETARTRAVSERTAFVGRRDLLLRALPLPDGGSVLGVVLDVTSLREAERARREFVANVSHELRTPITAIVGFSESVLDEPIPEHVRPMVEAIDRNARRLHALVADVLQLSRIEARRDDLPLDRERVGGVAQGVVDRFLAIAAARGVELLLEVEDDVQASINVEGFEHALQNLVDNAIKYTPAGGRVRVVVRSAQGRPEVEVSDTGIGIDPAHHGRIFERFYRVDPGRARDVGGTGLGLALVKHLCLAMRAEIVFTSALGHGSAFTLRLPP